MKKIILVIGHPLAAEENRLPFASGDLRYILCFPSLWIAPGLGVKYHALEDQGPENQRADLRSLPVLFPGKNSWFLWKGAGALMDSIQPDGIYCWEEPWCLSSFQLARLAARRGIPFAFYAAENKLKSLPTFFRWLRSQVYRSARTAIAITPEAATQLRESGFTKHCEIIPLWIRDFPPLRNPDAEPTIAYLGRLIPLKRVDMIIKTLRYLPQVRLRIIGDGPERAALELLSQTLKLQDRVTFTGPADNRELANRLEGCRLVVLPTGENERQAEQFGKAALEALSMGLPVLASSSGNYNVLSRKAPALRTCSINNEEEMAEAVDTLLSDRPSAQDRDDSRKWVRDQFLFKAVGPRFARLFEDVLLKAGDT